MSAKLLNVYVEEKRELEKQMGCMAGIFQMFDRRRLLSGRRLTGTTHKKLSSSGRSLARDSNQREECTPSSPQIILEYNHRKSSNGSPKKSSGIDTKSAHNDLGGIAKDSINGETRCLSVKTSIHQEVKKDNILKHRDSPRPILPLDLNASIQVIRRLKEPPSNLSEVSRFSCDGREIRPTKSVKVRESPRFSLDSLRNSKFDSKSKELDRSPSLGVPSLVAKLMGLEAMPISAPQDPSDGDSEKNHVRSSLEALDIRIPKQRESVYSQIERRVKDLDFQESNKDLRALKHILDKMQAKGLIETKKGNDQQAPQVTTPRAFESPIVIMKPGKSINGPDELEGLSGLRKLRTSGATNRKQTKDQEKRTEEISSPQKTRSPRPQQSARERSAGPVKTSSPRVQQRKVELERKPRLPTRRQPEESLSPKIKNRSKRNQEQKMTVVDADARSDNCSVKGKHKSLRILHEVSTAVVPPEQPSPISVLDASFYHDEELSPSPVKRISIALEDDESQTTSENLASLSKSSSEKDSLRLDNVTNLVQKLRHLSSTDDTESQEPVLDYVFEILASSGLLPEDISSETGKPHHMLMLDVVEEILAQKLESLSHCPQSNLIGGQFFLKELCSEIKWTTSERPKGANLDSEEEMCSKGLVGVERSGVVLEMERLIFKDLVDEIISGEANTSLLRRRRKLFT